MALKPDRFTWIVVAVVAVLLVAAVITVNRSVTDPAPADYRSDESPETPVYNAFVAAQRGEPYVARDQYSEEALAEFERNRYDPFVQNYRNNDTSRQLRIVNVETDPDDPTRAVVVVVEDNYTSSGPFGSGNTWSNKRTIPVIFEDDAWKIDAIETF